MGKTDGRRTDIHNSSQVEVMIFILQRTAQPPPVLMAGNAVHRIFLAIQIEPFAGNDLILAQAQRLYHFVDHFPVPDEAAHDFI